MVQIDPKTVLKSSVFHLQFWSRFWIVFDSILVPLGAPFGLQNLFKINSDFFFINLRQHNPQDHPKRPQDRSKRPQDRPKRPPRPSQEAPRAAQEAPESLPRGPKRHPRQPKTTPSGPKDVPRCPKTPEQHNHQNNFNTEYE